jgi:hypothetical protein
VEKSFWKATTHQLKKHQLPVGVALHEILDQDQNVVFPFAQRRHFDGKHIQPIEEILAERPIRYGGVQVAIRGSDNANVDLDRVPSPHSLEFPFLVALSIMPPVCRVEKFAHFVQENRSAVSHFEAAKPTLRGSREGSLFTARQFRGNQRGRNASTIHTNEGTSRDL